MAAPSDTSLLIPHPVRRRMKLYEYQGRELMTQFGIPAPDGVVVSSLEEFDAAKDDLSFPLVVKAQVLTGGRGKAGGVKFADDADEARAHVEAILGMTIKGLTVEKVFLVEKLDFAKELYAAVLIDRSKGLPMVMVSAEGGVEIESVPEDEIHKVHVHPFTGFSGYHARTFVSKLGLEKDEAKQVAEIVGKMVTTFLESDAELVEVNPMAVLADGRVVAADAKVVINDAAAFRHPEIEGGDEDQTPLEKEAAEKGIAFVQLEGRIGVIANGAGLTMATLDALQHYGGEGGVFLDLGGTDDPEKVKVCFELLKKAEPSVILLNLFGGITKSDTVAKGVKAVLDETGLDVPLVTRIRGVNEAEAREILKDAGVHTTETLQEAAKLTIELEKGGA